MKLEVVEDSKELKKPNRATAKKCPINIRKPADKLIKELIEVAISHRVFRPAEHTSAGSFIPKKNGMQD